MDYTVFHQINRFADHTTWAHWFFVDFANYGIALFAILLGAGWWIARRNQDMRAMSGLVGGAVGVFVALGIAQLVGDAVNRARPYATHANVHLLIDKTKDVSFPSDHSTVVGACAVAVLFASRRLGVLTAVLAVVMAFSRVYVGTHYPGDGLAGLALGALTALCFAVLLRPVVAGVIAKLSPTPLSVLFSPRQSTAS